MKLLSKRKPIKAFASIAVGVVVTDLANGAPIPVNNPSFEDITSSDSAHFDGSGHLLENHYSIFGFPGSPEGFSDLNAIPSWVYNGPGGAGTWNVPSLYIPSEASDGINIAWINLSGTIHQDIAETIEAGFKYTLRVDVGRLLSIPAPGYRIGLYAGDSVLAESVNSVDLPDGGFLTVSVSFTAMFGDPHVGDQLRILLGVGSDFSGDQVDFDNVRLDKEVIADSVPEASTLGATVIGIAGSVWVIVRRRRSEIGC